jgi:uncharacterized protein YheU (UPF0270 family)
VNEPILIPIERLSVDALEGLIDEFVTREGTDYGLETHSFDSKRMAVRKQLESGDVVIVFDVESESCNLIRRIDLPRVAG